MVHKNANIHRISQQPADLNTSTRTVKIGYRAVGGAYADAAIGIFKSFLTGKKNVGDTKTAPNILCHWCVVVGDWYHQLQATDGLNWYENNRVGGADGWALYTVGETEFNDAAIQNSGDGAIEMMPEKYQIQNNNCQTFTCTLLDQICRAGRIRVTTSYASFQATYLPGQELESEDGKVEVAVPKDGVKHTQFLDGVKDLMEQKTPALTDDDIAKAKEQAQQQAQQQTS